jgi:hypothetical protein
LFSKRGHFRSSAPRRRRLFFAAFGFFAAQARPLGRSPRALPGPGGWPPPLDGPFKLLILILIFNFVFVALSNNYYFI